MASTTPVPQLATTTALNASQCAVGAPVTPLQRLRIMDDKEWEAFILEWIDSLRAVYTDVHQCGGSGDLGRDVIGFKAGVNATSPWDNYQCKHYGQPLSVADVTAEVGKLLYHATKGEFSLPEQYYFVAPQGPSTALLKCLQKGTLKQELLNRWDKECSTTIVKGQTMALATVKGTIDAFDFSRITVLPPLRVIAGHQQTKYYAFRFGGGLPPRTMPLAKPPAAIQADEHQYIKKLLDAYAEEKGTAFGDIVTLQTGAPALAKHLNRSREQFFSAESLRTFSRDNVPPGTFESLQDEVEQGVQEVYDDQTHTSGYQRVVKTIQKARDIALTSNPLIGVVQTNDRAGICHQLANDDKLTWVHKPEDNA